MKSFDEVQAVRDQLEEKLLRHPAVSGIEIGTPAAETKPHEQGYVIRIIVNDPGIGHAQLGIARLYRQVPVVIRYREITLQQ